MRTLTDRERLGLVNEFLAQASGDLVGLWEVAKEVEALLGPGGTAREQSLGVVADLLAGGLVAGDPPYGPGGWQAWGDQDPAAVVARIRREWLGLGRTPDIPDIAWFGLPAAAMTDSLAP